MPREATITMEDEFRYGHARLGHQEPCMALVAGELFRRVERRLHAAAPRNDLASVYLISEDRILAVRHNLAANLLGHDVACLFTKALVPYYQALHSSILSSVSRLKMPDAKRVLAISHDAWRSALLIAASMSDWLTNQSGLRPDNVARILSRASL